MKLHLRGLPVLVGSAALVMGAALAVPASAAPANPAPANPYSPAAGHTYRHGVVPTLAVNAKMKHWAQTHASPAATTGPETLSYGGGIDGIGVQSGHSHVYLVFYGSQWGTATTSNGITSFSGDPDGGAPAAQKFFQGIGTNNELWSGVLTQYCDGSVSAGATSCPTNATYIPYQSGGVLSGVWYDNSTASPSAATGHQLGAEAVKAAAHFGNTTAASNRYSYYVILSPHGTNPDNYQGSYCAWHDYNGDSSLTGGPVTSNYGDIAFSNQPYNMDAGASCGVGFINSPGTLDGWTMTLGHEWSEMMTDQNPAGGWTNQTGSSYNGQENADECAWLSSGQGAAGNVTFSTGTFAVQSSWSNDTNECDLSHAVVSGGGGGSNTVTVTNPGNQTGTVGTAVSLQVHATDSGGAALTYSATGLPTGLSINATSGLISGTPSAAGTFNTSVTAKDSTGASGNAAFTWTIGTSGGGGSCSGQLLKNPGFESGSAYWTASSGVINTDGLYAHSGNGYAWLDGYGTTHTDTLSQAVTIPAGCTATLTYYLWIDSQEGTSYPYDTLTLTANGTAVQKFSNVNQGTGYVKRTVSLSAYAGKSVTLKWTGSEDASLATSFLIDDTALTVS